MCQAHERFFPLSIYLFLGIEYNSKLGDFLIEYVRFGWSKIHELTFIKI